MYALHLRHLIGPSSPRLTNGGGCCNKESFQRTKRQLIEHLYIQSNTPDWLKSNSVSSDKKPATAFTKTKE